MSVDVSKAAVDARKAKQRAALFGHPQYEGDDPAVKKRLAALQQHREKTLKWCAGAFVAIVLGFRVFAGYWPGVGLLALLLLVIGAVAAGIEQQYTKERALRRAAGLEE